MKITARRRNSERSPPVLGRQPGKPSTERRWQRHAAAAKEPPYDKAMPLRAGVRLDLGKTKTAGKARTSRRRNSEMKLRSRILLYEYTEVPNADER